MLKFYMIYFVLALLSAIFFALLEIQIEGKDGWAAKLPTWRKKFAFTRFIPGANKQITGYHLYTSLYRFSLLHIIFLFTPWSLGKELIIISLHILVGRIEDFMWFVLNPHFGIKKFNKKHVPWHTRWWGPLPAQYYLSILLWLVIFSLGIFLTGI